MKNSSSQSIQINLRDSKRIPKQNYQNDQVDSPSNLERSQSFINNTQNVLISEQDPKYIQFNQQKKEIQTGQDEQGEVYDNQDQQEQEKVIELPDSKKKRGPYNKGNKITGKEAFLQTYVESKDSIYSEWIEFDKLKDVLFCRICIQAGKRVQNIWGDITKGCPVFKAKSCEQHAISLAHQEALSLIKSSKTKITSFFTKPHNLEEQAIQRNPQNALPLSYKNLFENTYWVCKEELPISTVLH